MPEKTVFAATKFMKTAKKRLKKKAKKLTNPAKEAVQRKRGLATK
jgi:hypothetical protein